MKRSLLLILILCIFPTLLAAQAAEVTPVPPVRQTSDQAAPPSPAVPTSAQPAKSAEPTASENHPDSMPRRYVELWNTGNFDQMELLFSPPVAMVSRGNRVLLTFEMLRKVITAWRKSMPDLQFKIEDTMIEGDKVAMRLTFTGSYKERLFAGTVAPAPETPRTIRGSEMLMFHLKDGKINQIWEEYDELRMRVEMGGSWHTNEELEAIGRSSKPAGAEAPAATAPPKR